MLTAGSSSRTGCLHVFDRKEFLPTFPRVVMEIVMDVD